MATPILEQIFARVEFVPFSGCWLWTGYVDKDGYGKMYLKGEGQVRVHRLSWEIWRGAIPKGASVLHRCDVASCCNPAHLYVGDQYENMQDRKARKPSSFSKKLTQEDVMEIRKLFADGLTNKAVAKRFDITLQNAWMIRTRKIWPKL